jgi:Na+-driven multidrug efflux pump
MAAAEPKNASPLLSAPIPLMLRNIAVPFSVGAFFNTMYNVVDTIYGGLISDEALAALSLSFPVYFHHHCTRLWVLTGKHGADGHRTGARQ